MLIKHQLMRLIFMGFCSTIMVSQNTTYPKFAVEAMKQGPNILIKGTHLKYETSWLQTLSKTECDVYSS